MNRRELIALLAIAPALKVPTAIARPLPAPLPKRYTRFVTGITLQADEENFAVTAMRGGRVLRVWRSGPLQLTAWKWDLHESLLDVSESPLTFVTSGKGRFEVRTVEI